MAPRSRTTTRCRPIRPSPSANCPILFEPGALRAPVARRSRVCVRPRQRPHPGVQEGRHLRQELQVEPETRQNGAVWDLVLSEDKAQRYIFVADGANMQIIILDRADRRNSPASRRPGRMAGELKWVHNIAIDNAATSSRPKSGPAGACRSSGRCESRVPDQRALLRERRSGTAGETDAQSASHSEPLGFTLRPGSRSAFGQSPHVTCPGHEHHPGAWHTASMLLPSGSSTNAP